MSATTMTNHHPITSPSEPLGHDPDPSLIAALGPDDEHVPVEDWGIGHPLYGRPDLVTICQALDAAERYAGPLRDWWRQNRGIAGDMPSRLVELLDGFAGYVESRAATSNRSSAYRVVCDDSLSRHTEPFGSIPEADKFAVSVDHGCRGGRHSIVPEGGGPAIATSENLR